MLLQKHGDRINIDLLIRNLGDTMIIDILHIKQKKISYSAHHPRCGYIYDDGHKCNKRSYLKHIDVIDVDVHDGTYCWNHR